MQRYTVDPCYQPAFAVIHRKFCKVCGEKWQNYIFKVIRKDPEEKSKIPPLVATTVLSQVHTEFIINLPFWAP